MRDISFYLIHNNSKDRLELRNEIKNIANNFNIELIEIFKQRKSSKRNFGIWHKLTRSKQTSDFSDEKYNSLKLLNLKRDKAQTVCQILMPILDLKRIFFRFLYFITKKLIKSN